MDLTIKELTALWDDIIKVIDENFENERHTQLTKMYETFQERIFFAPASTNKSFFGAYPGGYMQHVLKVVNISGYMYKLWDKMGADMSTYTFEELMFCALNHDLGKLGDLQNDLYIQNPSDWHVKNQGTLYIHNPAVKFMPLPDRALWLLQEFNIKVSDNEYIAIKTYEGLLNDANDVYFKTYDVNKSLKSHLPILLHQADYMAYRIAHETDVNN